MLTFRAMMTISRQTTQNEVESGDKSPHSKEILGVDFLRSLRLILQFAGAFSSLSRYCRIQKRTITDPNWQCWMSCRTIVVVGHCCD
jgi:hypothetical protein